MIEPKLEVQAQLRELAEKTIDRRIKRAFGMFFDASSTTFGCRPDPNRSSTFSKNMKAALRARSKKLVHATDLD